MSLPPCGIAKTSSLDGRGAAVLARTGAQNKSPIFPLKRFEKFLSGKCRLISFTKESDLYLIPNTDPNNLGRFGADLKSYCVTNRRWKDRSKDFPFVLILETIISLQSGYHAKLEFLQTTTNCFQQNRILQLN